MCAICGIVDSKESYDKTSVIKKMADVQSHRGPNGEGFFVHQGVALGHRRLSIIDIANGAQPIFNETSDVVVILNGEIYNYKQLRSELISKGHVFKSNSDTEVIVHLYEELKDDAIAKLDGMFALAIYDLIEDKVIIARDRAGQKPLWYFIKDKKLAFSSELSALKLHPDFPNEINYNAIGEFLSLQYIPSPNTIYKEVKKLPPASKMIFKVNSGDYSISKYWQLAYNNKLDISERQAEEDITKLLRKAVEKRLMADVESGVFLSGGIDSSIIGSLMTELRDEKTHAFTIGFDNAKYDERSGARIAAKYINENNNNKLIHHEKVVDLSDFSLVEKLVNHFGEPYADASMLPTALLSEFAQKDITVALSGDGADELFCGYERYQAMSLTTIFDILPENLRRSFFNGIANIIPNNGERSKLGRIKRFLDCCATPYNERYFHMLNRFPSSLQKAINYSLPLTLDNNLFSKVQEQLSAVNKIEKLSELDFNLYLLNDILPKVDISSMASSLEVRSPFLDREVMQFAAQLPLEYKIKGNLRKKILRSAFSKNISPELLQMPKKGFGVPISDYLRNKWKDIAYERIFKQSFSEKLWFNFNDLEKLWDTHQSGKNDYGYLLWNMLILSIFFENEN